MTQICAEIAGVFRRCIISLFSGMFKAVGRGVMHGVARLSALSCLSAVCRLSALCIFSLLVLTLPGVHSSAMALEPIVLNADVDRVEITKFSEHYKEHGDTLQFETATDLDGIANRMSVKAQTPGTDPKWIVFALKNQTDKQMVRWVTADRYNIVGSRVLRPDLDTRRLVNLTPSVGFLPLRVPNDDVDIFSITLEPGATVTFVAELSNSRFPRVFLWQPLAYSKKLRDMTLFNGIMLGIVGILAIFLTAVFVANHKAIFPATAFIAWCVGAYLCVDFGFWHKLFRLDPEMNSLYRAATEAAIASSLVIFLYTFLRLSFWHGWIKLLFGIWILAQLGLIGLAVLDPVLVSSLARLSLLLIGGLGSILIGYLAVRGQDRALALVPTWLLFLVWLFGAGVAALGQLSGDIVSPALTSGLVLILVLFGFTVTQFAFRSFEPLAGAPPSQLQLRSLALEGAGAAVWQWNSRRDEISVSPEVEDALGLHEGELTCRVEQWMQYLHPADRERFRLLMRTLQEKNGGELQLEFRMRGHEGHFLWYELRAHSVAMPHQRSLRCVGLMRDITDTKRAQERLLGDAVHDSLTGLPNRELFLDRLHTSIARVKDEGGVRPPTVLFIDIDRFKHVNQSFGMVIGDTMLLTIARRLQRHLGPQDSLARLNGDQFAILLVTENNPQEIALLAERIRRSLRSPMKIGGKEIILTGSIGIAVYDGTQLTHQDLVNESELAMYRAKRSGTDRIEIFKPTMRGERDNRLALESDLRRAIERRQIKILYQPITKLKGEDLTGFEALMRWDHPKHGRLSPDEFIPIAEESDLISELGSYVLNQAVKDAVQWNRILPRADEPLVVSINISSRELFRQELYQEVRMILARESLPEGSLRLEVTESLVMENPEGAVEILGWLRNAGASLALDDFGTGYSSLSYLHRFPFDTLKVDRSIVHNVAAGKTGPAILRSVVALAGELGMDVVAEGVETLEDVAFLRTIGCGYAQGFYFGEAMNQKDVIYLLEALAKDVKIKGRTGLFGAIRAKSGADIKIPDKALNVKIGADGKVISDGVGYIAETGPDVGLMISGVNKSGYDGDLPAEAAAVPQIVNGPPVGDMQQVAPLPNVLQPNVAESQVSHSQVSNSQISQAQVSNSKISNSQISQAPNTQHNSQSGYNNSQAYNGNEQAGGLSNDAAGHVGGVDPLVAAALADLGDGGLDKNRRVAHEEVLQAGGDSNKKSEGTSDSIARPEGQPGLDQKHRSLAEALNLTEKVALAGSANGARRDELRDGIDNKISGLKSAIQPKNSTQQKSADTIDDVYAQLASGGRYSEIAQEPIFSPDSRRDSLAEHGENNKKERKFKFDNKALKGGLSDSGNGNDHIANANGKRGPKSSGQQARAPRKMEKSSGQGNQGDSPSNGNGGPAYGNPNGAPQGKGLGNNGQGNSLGNNPGNGKKS